jgi:hypothetical protein
LIRSLCFSVPCNFIFCIGAILQLFGKLEPFCPASLIGIEMLWVPQVMLETGFFVFVALEASGRAIDVKWSKRLTISVLISCVLITVLVFWLLAETTKGVHYGTSLPWCWIPGSNTEGESSESAERDKAVLTALRLISAYLWLLIADVVGVMAFIYFLFRLRRYIQIGTITKVEPAVKLRLLYFLYYLLGNAAMLLHRFGLVPEEADYILGILQAWLEPSFSGMNAFVLMISERSWLFWGLTADDHCGTDSDSWGASRAPTAATDPLLIKSQNASLALSPYGAGAGTESDIPHYQRGSVVSYGSATRSVNEEAAARSNPTFSTGGAASYQHHQGSVSSHSLPQAPRSRRNFKCNFMTAPALYLSEHSLVGPSSPPSRRESVAEVEMRSSV